MILFPWKEDIDLKANGDEDKVINIIDKTEAEISWTI